MRSYTKPLYEVYKQLEYRRHQQRLQTISLYKPQQYPCIALYKMHYFHYSRRRHYANDYYLNHNNEQLLIKLLDISKRRHSVYTTNMTNHNNRITTYNNPARKRRQKEIYEKNQMMAYRILSRNSPLAYKQLRKSMYTYEKLRKSNLNNRRAINSNFLPTLPDRPRNHRYSTNNVTDITAIQENYYYENDRTQFCQYSRISRQLYYSTLTKIAYRQTKQS